MKKALLLTTLALGFVFAMPREAAACYDRCVGAPGTCKTCETGFDLTFQVCVQTQACKCITYFVPSYQCTGLTVGGTSQPAPASTLHQTPVEFDLTAEPSASTSTR